MRRAIPGLPPRVKKAKVYIDKEGRITFPRPNEAPADEEWWANVLKDPRASLSRRKLHDKQLGYFASMLVEIFCGNCQAHELLAVDDLVKMHGRECNIEVAVSQTIVCTRSHKSCELQFKMRQWEDIARRR